MIKIRGYTRGSNGGAMAGIWIDPNKVDVIERYSTTHYSIYVNGVYIMNVSQEDVDRLLTYRLGDIREQQIKSVMDE